MYLVIAEMMGFHVCIYVQENKHPRLSVGLIVVERPLSILYKYQTVVNVTCFNTPSFPSLAKAVSAGPRHSIYAKDVFPVIETLIGSKIDIVCVFRCRLRHGH